MKRELIYLDDENHIVESDKATHAVIRETDENGNLVKEIISQDKPAFNPDSEIVDVIEVTPEMQKVLDEFDKNN